MNIKNDRTRPIIVSHEYQLKCQSEDKKALLEKLSKEKSFFATEIQRNLTKQFFWISKTTAMSYALLIVGVVSILWTVQLQFNIDSRILGSIVNGPLRDKELNECYKNYANDIKAMEKCSDEVNRKFWYKENKPPVLSNYAFWFLIICFLLQIAFSAHLIRQTKKENTL